MSVADNMPWLKAIDAVRETPQAMALVIGGTIACGNDAFALLCGGEAVGKDLEQLFDDQATDQLRWMMQSPVVESDKVLLFLRDGDEVMVEFWPFNKKVSFLVLRREYSLDRLADMDELTRLSNRRKARMMLNMEAARLDREHNFCLALGDIDYFKKINDTYGHNVGDDVLRHVSEIIRSVLRKGDWAARWGGEEFLIYVNNSNLINGIQPIERLRQRLESNGFQGKEATVAATMSFGLVSSQEILGKSDLNIDVLIESADTLLYLAKKKGRNRVEMRQDEIANN